jgi:hypothetical protein
MKHIQIIENIHMKQRIAEVAFSIKTREAKDRNVDSQFKNALDELRGDAANFGAELAMRKLVMAHVSLQIAQNLGIDYHAATEELYYYMRKREEETHDQLMQLVRSMIERGAKK